jgi:hypothetical protein
MSDVHRRLETAARGGLPDYPVTPSQEPGSADALYALAAPVQQRRYIEQSRPHPSPERTAPFRSVRHGPQGGAVRWSAGCSAVLMRDDARTYPLRAIYRVYGIIVIVSLPA